MKKILVSGLVLMLAVSVAPLAYAAPLLMRGENIDRDTVLTDDGYFVGENINVAKDVKGDLVIAGGDVTVSGNVSGDVLVVGGTVNITGKIGDDLRVMGGTVNLVGSVGDDAAVAAGSLTIADGSTIKGDLAAAAGTVSLYGRVSGDAHLAVGDAKVNGTVDGDMDLRYSERVAFGGNAKILGNLNYWAERENSDLSKFGSKVQFHPSSELESRRSLATILTAAGFAGLVWKWLFMLFVGAMIIWFLPRLFPRLVDSMKAQEGATKHILTGILFIFLVPLVAGVFAVTVLGLPIAAIIFFVYLISLILSGIVGSYAVGSFLRQHRHRNQWDQFANLALGTLVIMFVSYIPVLGWVVCFLSVAYGLGVLWQEKSRLIAQYRGQE